MTGGFHNVVGEEVLRQLRGVEGTKGLCGWVEQFVSPGTLRSLGMGG